MHLQRVARRLLIRPLDPLELQEIRGRNERTGKQSGAHRDEPQRFEGGTMRTSESKAEHTRHER